jgi:hypothetical protein
MINFSGLVLTGTVDGNPASLQAGLNAAQPIGRSASAALRATVKNSSHQAYAGSLELKKNERALLLLLPPFYKGSPELSAR